MKIILAVALLITTVSSVFTIQSFAISPNTAKSSNSHYTFFFKSPTPITTSFDLSIHFPPTLFTNFILQPSSCSISINQVSESSPTCSYSTSNNYLTFSNLQNLGNVSNYTVTFNASTTRYAANANLTFYYNNVGTNVQSAVNRNVQQVSFSNVVMVCSWGSASEVIGSTTEYSVGYVPGVEVESGSILQVSMQPWGPYKQSNFISTTPANICEGKCSLITPANNLGIAQLLKYASLFSQNTSASGTLKLTQVKNPPSSQPISLTIKISTSTFNSYMTCSSTLTVTNPNTISTLSFTGTEISTAIGALNIRTMSIVPKNPVSANSVVIIQPNILELTYTYSMNFPTGASPVVTTQESDGSLVISNLVSPTITSSPNFILLRNFTLKNPPYSNKPVSLTFQIKNKINSTFYKVQQSTVSITSTPSQILQKGISLSEKGINSQSNYTIWFMTVNGLVNSSFIVVTFPSEISLDQSSCSITGHSCMINNRSSLTVDLSTSVLKNTNLTINVASAVNPPTTTTTYSIIIKTYYEDSSSLVDQLSSGLEVTAESVISVSATITPQSTKVADTTSYLLELQISNPLPQGSIMRVQLPNDSYPLTNIIMKQFRIDGGNNVTGCTMTVLGDLYVQMNGVCFNVAVPKYGIISILLGNITNPSSTKPSQSWEIETLYNGIQMEYLNTGIVYALDTPADLSSLAITPSSLIVNREATYTISIAFQFPHYHSDRIILYLPNSISLLTGFACTSSTASVTLSCSKNTDQNLLYINIFLSGVSSISSFDFTVTKMKNLWYVQTRNFLIKTTTNDTSIFYKEEANQDILYTAETLSVSINQDQRIVLLGVSDVEINIQTPVQIPVSVNASMVVLSVVVPTQITPIADTCTLSYADGSCQVTGRSFSITGLSTFSDPLVLTFQANTLYFTTQSSIFTIKLTYNSLTVARFNTLRLKAYCSNPCQQCTSSSTTECLSCLPSHHTQNNTYFRDQSLCLQQCYSGYFENNGECLQCDSSKCFECEGTESNCTACNGTKYFYLSQCLETCPSTHYGQNNLCKLCIPPCLTCTSPTFCISCQTSYTLDIDNTCRLQCSLLDHITINGTCQACTSNCATCSQSLSNCTTCDDQYLFHNHTCLERCPTYFYRDGNDICQACVEPCVTCLAVNECLNCVEGFYLYEGTTCTRVCPNTTVPIVEACQPCEGNCSTCSGSVTYCTSCPSGFYFYLNQCLSECPPLLYPHNKTCTACIDPCVTCASSPSLCTSCISGKYLLNEACVNSCPENGYFTSDQECIACADNCLYCESIAACTMCEQGYFLLNGGCVLECPESSPIVVDRVCKACAEQCATCTGTPDNCSTCTVYYFRYEYTCVEECPLAFYSNVATYECEDGLTTRITFFPILIIALIITVITLISKCCARETSTITSLTALYSPLQLAIWIYLLSLMFRQIKQPGVNYQLPTALFIVPIISFLILSLIFLFLNRQRVESDEYAQQWNTNNVNFNVYRFVKYISLLLGLKFFRIIYSRMFNAMPLSMVCKYRSNVFTVPTVFGLLQLVLCEILAIVGCWSLVYNKSIKDQIFYTAIEGLIVTILAVLVTLIDIYKAENYFEQSQFSKMKKYIEKVRDSSFNKLEQGFDVSHDEGSVDAQRFVGMSGNKLMYSKGNFKDLYFEEQENKSHKTQEQASEGIITEAFETENKNNNINKPQKKVNIFKPIMQEEEEYLQDQKFPEEEAYTQLQLEKKNKKNKTLESDEENDFSNKVERKIELGADEPFDDNTSLIGDRSIKKRWNDFMTKRKELIGKIIKNQNIKLTKVVEPFILEEEEDEISPKREEAQVQTMEFNEGDLTGTRKKKRRRKTNAEKNKELQEIYLQRLSEKKPKISRELFSEQKGQKYDF